MDFASYSLALLVGFVATRYVTETTKIHLRFKGLWIHHWVLAAVAMIALWYLEVNKPYLGGALTGVALEGLPRKNWSIRQRK